MQNNLLKRLDIIKNAVAMEEDELIELQLKKIKQYSLDNKVQHIIELIENKQFKNIIQLIDQYKHDNSGLTVFEDPQIQGLKLELKVLETQTNELSDEKIEYECQINQFNSEYMLHLGDLIEQILKLEVISIRESEEAQEEAQQAYESFQKKHQQQLDELSNELNEEEKQHLKKAYRQASQLCHPDKLTDDFKQQGEAFFKALNEAYRRQNLNQVEEILRDLKTGATLNTASETLDNKILLEQRISLLRERIHSLEAEIKRIIESEVYRRIQKIEDMEKYFSELKQELEIELALLQKNNA
ncbi:MAG: J domain-containing protein [Methylococcales bacterium]|nr:J domain-containing protein [Methylococcales bacterium]